METIASSDEQKRPHGGPGVGFHDLFRRINVPILIFRAADEAILEANAEAERVYGLSREELLGRSLKALTADVARGEEEIRSILERGGTRNFETVHFHSDGRRLNMLVSCSLIEYEGEQAVLCFARDITERHRAKTALARNARELEKTVQELQAARKRAEAATTAKSEFLATMSHEIRTPMNGIVGMTDLLLDGVLTEEQREFVETIRVSGEALLTIINDILDLSKIEAGRLELEHRPFEVRRCTEEALDLVATTAADKGLELGYLAHEEVPSTVVGDVTRVRQVLVNLLSNAIKFTEEGEVLVTISVAQGDDQAGAVPRYLIRFDVRDTGVGIPDDRDDLFEPFEQGDASTTRKHGGTGLGLAISKHLTELMGGRIWMESEEGVGSTFSFTIEADAVPAEKPPFLQHDQPILQGRRILVVADRDTNRRLLVRHAERWGMKVRTAAAAEALRTLDQDPFDLVLLDVPGSSARTLAEAIRRRDDVLHVVSLVSINHPAHDLDTTAASGSRRRLYKPLKPAQLYNLLGLLFDPNQERAHAPADEPVARKVDPERMGLRLLLVEDNRVNRKVMRHMLDRLGYNANVATDGHQALQVCARTTYDVILMDVQMPEMDGVEVTRRLRERHGPRYPYIIATTANAMQEDSERCLAAGMNAYLSKPVQLQHLAEALDEAQAVLEADGYTPADTSAIDAGAFRDLHEMVGGDGAAFVSELVDDFLDDAPTLIAAMQEAVSKHDRSGLERAAHTLKSSSSMFGAVDLSEICGRIEAFAEQKAFDDAAAQLAHIHDHFSRVRQALQALR